MQKKILFLRNKKFWASTLLSFGLLVLAVLPSVGLADGSFLCSPGEGGGDSDGFYACFNRIYDIAIVVGAIVAVAMIATAGYLYMFSGGNEKNVGKAKDYITTSIIGLVILLGGFLVLQQINPDILLFRSISPEQIDGKAWDITGAGEDDDGYVIPSKKTGARSGRSEKLYETSCAKDKANCVNITQVAGVECKDTCSAQKAIVEKLKELKQKTPDVNWIVTEAWPPTANHKDDCHRTGSCVDIAIRPNDPEGKSQEWLKMCTAIRTISGVGMLNEINSSFSAQCGNFVNRSAAHISFFLVSSSSLASGAVATVPSNYPVGSVKSPISGLVCNGGTPTKGAEAPVCGSFTAEISAASSSSGLSTSIIRTLIHIESQFKTGSQSGQGAIGLMQVTSPTAQAYGCNQAFPRWASDPGDNIKCGARIFSQLMKKYGGSKMDAAIAEYNGGAGANLSSIDCPGLARWQCSFNDPQHNSCNTGYLETRNYVQNYKVLLPKYQSSCGGQ